MHCGSLAQHGGLHRRIERTTARPLRRLHSSCCLLKTTLGQWVQDLQQLAEQGYEHGAIVPHEQQGAKRQGWMQSVTRLAPS